MGRTKSTDAPDLEVDRELAPGAAVYDPRGNVRPHGTPGAIPMTFAERRAIAEALAAGETPPPLDRTPEVPLPEVEDD
jgi:hypothetical protein